MDTKINFAISELQTNNVTYPVHWWLYWQSQLHWESSCWFSFYNIIGKYYIGGFCTSKRM